MADVQMKRNREGMLNDDAEGEANAIFLKTSMLDFFFFFF